MWKTAFKKFEGIWSPLTYGDLQPGWHQHRISMIDISKDRFCKRDFGCIFYGFYVFFCIFCIFFVSTYEKKVYQNSIQSKNIKRFFLSLRGFIFADRYVRGFLIISYGKFGLNSPKLKLKAITEYPTLNEEKQPRLRVVFFLLILTS